MNRFEDLDTDLLALAARLIAECQLGSVSMLQRRLGIRYGQACLVMDALEQAGIVGPPIGGGARAVLCDDDPIVAAHTAVTWLTNRKEHR
jgi:S-DNA-T family DNA segregation ATPase FtsK/SpoIIIE